MVWVFKRELLVGITANGVSANSAYGIDTLDGFTDDELIAARYRDHVLNVKIMQNPTPSDTIRIYEFDGSILENRDRLAEMGMIPEKQILFRTSEDESLRICISEYAVQFVTSVIPIDSPYIFGILRGILQDVLWLLSVYYHLEFNFDGNVKMVEGLVTIGKNSMDVMYGHGTIDRIRLCYYMLFLPMLVDGR